TAAREDQQEQSGHVHIREVAIISNPGAYRKG
ncbi:MAG: hypothetical protein ACI9VR_004463, partial [Cognaticolwellia sp.]